MSTAEPNFPEGLPLHPNLKEFYKNYIYLVDATGKSEEWAKDCFTEDATLELNCDATAKGSNEIVQVREAANGPEVEKVLHTIYSVYPFGPNALETMHRGIVEQWLKDGSHTLAKFTGWIKFAEVGDGKLKIDHYGAVMARKIDA